MKRMQLLWQGAAWLAVSGMCLPTSFVLAGDVRSMPATAAAQPTSPIQDVALQPGGMLVGQVLDKTMQPMRGTAIVIQMNGQTAATTTSDINGVFAVNGSLTPLFCACRPSSRSSRPTRAGPPCCRT